VKIPLSTIPSDFVCREVSIANENCFLVFPAHMGVTWTKDNLHFRSSIWNTDGELVSASFKKFFNWNEQPELAYSINSLTADGGCHIVEKIDGSTLILSKYKNELIVRTRGTLDINLLHSGPEIEELRFKYPSIFNNQHLDDGYSLIYEWCSPSNTIVIPHPKPELVFIGMISHDDYSMQSQHRLDIIAKQYGWLRPKWYSFDCVDNLISAVAKFKNIEGVCVYCNHDQDIRKLKGEEYLLKHRQKSLVGSKNQLINLFFENGCLPPKQFLNFVEGLVDFEVYTMCLPNIFSILETIEQVKILEIRMKSFVRGLSPELTRKQKVESIFTTYKDHRLQAFVFRFLDHDSFSEIQVKKIFSLIIKNELDISENGSQ